MKKRLLQYYQIFTDLSLDVVLGVICCMIPLPSVFHYQPGLNWYVGLPLATWVIYLTDHMMDLRMNPTLQTSRHDFLRKYSFKIFMLILMLSLVLFLLNVVRFDSRAFNAGLITALLCLLYFILSYFRQDSWKWLYNKELMVAFIYAAGIFIVFGLNPASITLWLYLFLVFTGLVYQNILLLSILEIREDLSNKQFSWASVIGREFSTGFFYALTAALILLLSLSLKMMPDSLHVVLISYMLMCLANIALLRSGLAGSYKSVIRKSGEMVFWIPGIVYLLSILLGW